MPEWNLIIEILKIGLPGLVFLLSFFAFRLLSREQQKQHPNPSVLATIRYFMLINVAFGLLTLIAPIADHLLRGMTDRKEIDQSNVRQATFYGYFNDLNEKHASYPCTEVLNLTLTQEKRTPKVEVIKGESAGEVMSERGQKVQKTWGMTGFKVGDRFVISYFASSSSHDQGSGAIYLRQKGQSYVGYWLGRDNITGENIQAPYVLLSEEILLKEAQKKYPELAEPARLVKSGPVVQPNK